MFSQPGGHWANGQVLAAGGSGLSGVLASAELYTP